MEQKEIIERLKVALNIQKDKDLAAFLGVDKSTLSNYKSGNRDIDYKSLFSKCKQINIHWLITGEGEMLLPPTKGNINYINGGNNVTGNVNGGQMLNITMPESGRQKIIKPNGKIKIQRTDSTKSVNTREAELLKENSDLKERIAFLEGSMKGKDDLIANLQKTIELLCNRQ